MAVLLAGFPFSVPASTINRLCGSSMDALHQAARAIWCGEYEIVIAGGVESMTRAPYAIAKNVSGQTLYGNLMAYDTALGWRFPNPQMEEIIPFESMGETAENVASMYNIAREEQDLFALRSHQLSVQAQNQARWKDEIVPVPVRQKRGETILLEKDEGPRPDTSLEKLGELPPVFRSGGSVTAGNSSSLNDGASALLMMSEKRSKELGLKPFVRIVSTGIAGVDPRCMGTGPVPATEMALKKARLTIADIDLVELDEAFASQSLAVIRELGINPDLVNVNGGAIALGHPLGCSGARIVTSLVHEMKLRGAHRGIATMCIGVGQGIATIVEQV
jgi:acetyl-CoA acetyltransferase family protein